MFYSKTPTSSDFVWSAIYAEHMRLYKEVGYASHLAEYIRVLYLFTPFTDHLSNLVPRVRRVLTARCGSVGHYIRSSTGSRAQR